MFQRLLSLEIESETQIQIYQPTRLQNRSQVPISLEMCGYDLKALITFWEKIFAKNISSEFGFRRLPVFPSSIHQLSPQPSLTAGVSPATKDWKKIDSFF